MKKELDYCPFKGVKNAGVAINGRRIFTFDCPYAKKNNFEETKKADKKETSMRNRFRFRVWDKETKTCFDNGMIDTLAPISTWVKNGWVVEQCTGLKDKNGKLIYEGDIVKRFLKCDEDEHILLKVEWDNEDCRYITTDKKHDAWYFSLMYYSYEVVGNIHANPELL